MAIKEKFDERVFLIAESTKTDFGTLLLEKDNKNHLKEMKLSLLNNSFLYCSPIGMGWLPI